MDCSTQTDHLLLSVAVALTNTVSPAVMASVNEASNGKQLQSVQGKSLLFSYASFSNRVMWQKYLLLRGSAVKHQRPDYLSLFAAGLHSQVPKHAYHHENKDMKFDPLIDSALDNTENIKTEV